MLFETYRIRMRHLLPFGMRIDRLRLRNFRCYEDQEFSFDPDFSVLIGRNGTGKTATLEALAIAAGTWLKGIQGQTAPTIQRSDARLVGRSYHGETSYEEQYGVEIEAWGAAQNVEGLSWIREVRTQGGNTRYARAKRLIALAKGADDAVRRGDDSVVLPVVAYYGAGRLWERMRNTKRRRNGSAVSEGDAKRETSRFVGYRDCIDRRTNARDFAQWMERQDRKSYQRSEETLFYRMVRKAAAGMLEEVSDVRFDTDREEVVAEFAGGRLVPFSMLSDGQRNMLALAGDLAVRMIRLNLPLGERALELTPGIVLIDEIDLHLHPSWQRHIVDDLRRTFPRIQFIATTHSPFIIQTLREGELVPLDAQPVAHTANLSIEAIAKGLMHVADTEVSPHYREMVDVAKEYLAELEEAPLADETKLTAFKERLAARVAPYADNPAFQAFLEMERIGALGV